MGLWFEMRNRIALHVVDGSITLQPMLKALRSCLMSPAPNVFQVDISI